MAGTAVLFDVAGIEYRPGRYGTADLRCPSCTRWRGELVIDGAGAVMCWPCKRETRW